MCLLLNKMLSTEGNKEGNSSKGSQLHYIGLFNECRVTFDADKENICNIYVIKIIFKN